MLQSGLLFLPRKILSMSTQTTLLGSFSVSSIAIILVLVFAGYSVVRTYLQYRRLRHIKGPWLASVSPLWMFYYACCGTLYLATEDALKKYGKLTSKILRSGYLISPGSPVRIGPNVVMTDDPVIQRHMAAPRSPWLKGRWFRGMKFDPRVDNLLSMTDEKRILN